MTYAEKHILETYSTIFENLSFKSKVKLLQKMVTALRRRYSAKKKTFSLLLVPLRLIKLQKKLWKKSKKVEALKIKTFTCNKVYAVFIRYFVFAFSFFEGSSILINLLKRKEFIIVLFLKLRSLSWSRGQRTVMILWDFTKL